RGCGRRCEPTASDPRGSVLGWLAHAVVVSPSSPPPSRPQNPLPLCFLLVLPPP
ncbi:hypothetical protein N657DRAFT_650665, partial [Parathielavia appendiculata]